MDIYFKTIGGALIALVLFLTLSGTEKNYAMLLGLLACSMILGAAMTFLEPVLDFLSTLESLIELDIPLLQILLKAVGIAVIGDLAAMICVDGGNNAIGKALQLLTTLLILWLSLPLLQALLDIIRQILEAV